MTSSAETETFTIDELAERTQQWLAEHGLDAYYYRRVQDAPSERTIRYYRTHGLLDEPVRNGKERRYTRRHLLQLLAIKALQTRGLSHDRIQSHLYGRSDAELEAVIAAALPASRASVPPVAVVHEYVIAPGVRLSLDPDVVSTLAPDERAAVVARIEAALAGRHADDATEGEPRS